MSDDALVLADELGPRGRRRVLVATVASGVVLAVVVVAVLNRFADRGQLDWERWEFISQWSIWRFLLRGLRNTLTAALVAMALSLVLGAIATAGRLHANRAVRGVAIVGIELLRATPLVLLIYFMGQFIPRYGPDIGSYWYLVAGLTAYNGSVIAEIYRAGIASLPSGQREAGLSIGLTEGQVLRRILFPQGVRRMVPALVNQLVTLLKDSSLGALVLLPAVDDLLHQGRIVGDFTNSTLQALIVTALMYVLVNLVLSVVARRLELRQARRFGPAALGPVGAAGLVGDGLAGGAVALAAPSAHDE
jgi:glutamate transport system permease protein